MDREVKLTTLSTQIKAGCGGMGIKSGRLWCRRIGRVSAFATLSCGLCASVLFLWKSYELYRTEKLIIGALAQVSATRSYTKIQSSGEKVMTEEYPFLVENAVAQIRILKKISVLEKHIENEIVWMRKQVDQKQLPSSTLLEDPSQGLLALVEGKRRLETEAGEFRMLVDQLSRLSQSEGTKVGSARGNLTADAVNALQRQNLTISEARAIVKSMAEKIRFLESNETEPKQTAEIEN